MAAGRAAPLGARPWPSRRQPHRSWQPQRPQASEGRCAQVPYEPTWPGGPPTGRVGKVDRLTHVAPHDVGARRRLNSSRREVALEVRAALLWKGVDKQACVLLERYPDALALQEVTAQSLPLWEAVLGAAGL